MGWRGWPDGTAKLWPVNTVETYQRHSDPKTGCHGFGVFDKAVASWFDTISEEHGLTEDGKTVAPRSPSK